MSPAREPDPTDLIHDGNAQAGDRALTCEECAAVVAGALARSAVPG